MSSRLLGRGLSLMAGLVLLAAPVGRAAMAPVDRPTTTASPAAAAVTGAAQAALTGTPATARVAPALVMAGVGDSFESRVNAGVRLSTPGLVTPLLRSPAAAEGHTNAGATPAATAWPGGHVFALAAVALLALALARKPRETGEGAQSAKSAKTSKASEAAAADLPPNTVAGPAAS